LDDGDRALREAQGDRFDELGVTGVERLAVTRE
jgi:hypothetical protein